MITETRYRISQFFNAINAAVSPSDSALVNSILGQGTPALMLFRRMSLTDQQHAIAVLKALIARQQTDSALQKSALLHDVGKSLGQPVIHRILVVILQKCCPALLQKLADASLNCPKWRQPFVVNFHHPKIGAEMAQKANCDSLVVKLIAAHQRLPKEKPMTQFEIFHAALYAADNEN